MGPDPPSHPAAGTAGPATARPPSAVALCGPTPQRRRAWRRGTWTGCRAWTPASCTRRTAAPTCTSGRSGSSRAPRRRARSSATTWHPGCPCCPATGSGCLPAARHRPAAMGGGHQLQPRVSRAPHRAAGAGQRRTAAHAHEPDRRAAPRPHQAAVGDVAGRGARLRGLRRHRQDAPRDDRRGRRCRPADRALRRHTRDVDSRGAGNLLPAAHPGCPRSARAGGARRTPDPGRPGHPWRRSRPAAPRGAARARGDGGRPGRDSPAAGERRTADTAEREAGAAPDARGWSCAPASPCRCAGQTGTAASATRSR